MNASIGDLIISFNSSGTSLASDSFKVDCKSALFFQFLADDFLDFLFGGFECFVQISVYFLCQANSCNMFSLVSTLADGIPDYHQII